MSETEQPASGTKGFLEKLQSAFSASKEFSLESLALAQKGGRELQSPLNAIFGDRLEDMQSPMALPMRIYARKGQGDEFVRVDPEGDPGGDALKACLTPTTGDSASKLPDRVCVFIHGLGSSERTWEIRRKSRDGAKPAPTSYSKLLARDSGHACVYIRYNTGRHISKNGRELADLLEAFARAYPAKLHEINLIGHSMGGLVSRSAAFYGQAAGHSWIKLLTRNLLLGSPLLGAHQEQIGKLTTDILNAIPLPGTRVTAHFLDFRSDGIQDLGYGYLRDEDWDGSPADDDAPGGALKNRRRPVPLLKHARYYLVIGSLSKDPDGIVGGFLGDGIVNRWSARGQSGQNRENYEGYGSPEKNAGNAGDAGPEKTQVASREIVGLSHTAIPGDPRVYRQVRDWLRD
ncbi:MAG: GPI inositol-deacylase [bacterium]|nr:GPI inositol-deacylase [bacterium]